MTDALREVIENVTCKRCGKHRHDNDHFTLMAFPTPVCAFAPDYPAIAAAVREWIRRELHPLHDGWAEFPARLGNRVERRQRNAVLADVAKALGIGETP